MARKDARGRKDGAATPTYTVLLRARGPVDKRALARRVTRIAGCQAVPLPRMDGDELRDNIAATLEENPRTVKRRFKVFADAVDVGAVPVKVLRDFMRREWGEDVLAVELELYAVEAAAQLRALAKDDGLRVWDELAAKEWNLLARRSSKPKRTPKPKGTRRFRGVEPALNDLNKRGFVLGRFLFGKKSFSVGRHRYRPEQLEEVEAHRFPSKKSGSGVVVRALIAPDGRRGAILQPYGPHEHPPLIALLQRVRGARYFD